MARLRDDPCLICKFPAYFNRYYAPKTNYLTMCFCSSADSLTVSFSVLHLSLCFKVYIKRVHCFAVKWKKAHTQNVKKNICECILFNTWIIYYYWNCLPHGQCRVKYVSTFLFINAVLCLLVFHLFSVGFSYQAVLYPPALNRTQ